MKTFKKVNINASPLDHAEMKGIRGGFYGGYVCYKNTSNGNEGTTHWCDTASGSSCMNENGRIGSCRIRINPADIDASPCFCSADGHSYY